MHRKARSRSGVFGLAAVLVGVTTLASVSTYARAREDQKSDAATRKSEEGTKAGAAAVDKGDFGAARKLLSEAYKAAPNPATLFQLGRLAAAEGRKLQAQDFMRRYLFEAGSEAGEAEQKEAQRLLQEERPPSGELLVVGDRGALVYIDDRLVAVLPLPVPLLVDAEEHRVSIEVGSRKLADQIKVPVGRNAEMRFKRNPDLVAVSMRPAILYVTAYDKLPVEQQLAVERGVEQATRKREHSLLASRWVVNQAPQAASCLDKVECQADLAKSAELRTALAVKIEAKKRNGGELKISAALINATMREPAAERHEVCTGCNAEQLAAKLASTIDAILGEGLTRGAGVLSIVTDPEGAALELGGRAIGKSPLKRPFWAGPVEITAKLRGHDPVVKQVEVVADAETALQFALNAPEPDPSPLIPGAPLPPPTRPRWRLIAGGVTLGAGAVVLGFGISALVLNGRMVERDPGAPMGVYNTGSVGAGLTAVGVGLLAGGAILIALPPPRRPAAK